MSSFIEYRKIIIMKKFLFAMVFVLGIALQSHGQHFLNSWEEYEWDHGPDSAAFAFYLGSVEEYNYQNNGWDKEHRAIRYQFIEAKTSYAIFFVNFLYKIGVCGNSVEIDATPGRTVLRVGGCNVGMGIQPMFVDMKVDEDNRIKSVVITGAPKHLIPTFQHQWNISDQDMLGVHKGGKLSVMRLDEIVTFDWTRNEPRILVKPSGANNLKRINEKQKQ